MGLFDREFIGDCGMLPTGSGPRGLRSPHEAEYREVYQKEKIYGMTDAELRVYLKARPGQLVDPYPDGSGDTLH
jgi:hypothetical protein